jgi:hypothetical protein
MADSGATTATGTRILENGFSYLQSYNGLKQVTAVPTTTSFEYTISAELKDATGTIVARTQPCVTASATIERFAASYTPQAIDKFWAVVVLGNVEASKDRNSLADGVSNIQRGEHFRQQTIQPFTIYVFIPTTTEIAAREARDDAEDLFRPICQSVLFTKFDSQLFVGKQGPVQFSNHGVSAYNTAFYVHSYDFQQTVDITFDDTVGFDDDVAFRDIDLTIGLDFGTQELTASIDLDEDPL